MNDKKIDSFKKDNKKLNKCIEDKNERKHKKLEASI